MRTWRLAAGISAALASIGVGLAGAAPAAAVTSVAAGAVTASPASAGAESSYTIAFTPATALPSGGTITLTAPLGTDFVGCTTCAGIYSIAVASGTAPTVTTAVSSSTAAANNNQLVLTISGSIAAGDQVTVTTQQTLNPTVASTAYQITESTSSDAAAIPSADYTITNAAAASITVSSGTPESAQEGTAFAKPLAVVVDDAYGNPVANQSVTFVAPSSAPSATFASCVSNPQTYECLTTTNTSGVATSSAVTADSTAGSYTVTASTSITSGTGTAAFDLTNTAAAPSSVVGGDVTVSAATVGATGVDYSASFYPTTAVPNGGTITLTAPAGTVMPSGSGCPTSCPYSVTYGSGPTAVQVESVTTANAGASATANQAVLTVEAVTIDAVPAGSTASVGITGVTNPTRAGDDYIEESTSAQPAPAASEAYSIAAAAASSITVSSGTNQTATVGNQFAYPLALTVEDAYGNPVPGTEVTFTLPASGASGTFAKGAGTEEEAANSSGVVYSTPVTANSQTGSWSATAELADDSASAKTFSLTNAAVSQASQVEIVSGGGQSTAVGTAFAQPIVVEVLDQYGNPVPGASVTLASQVEQSGQPVAGGTFASGTTSSGGVNLETDTTGSNGEATSSTLTADAVAGSWQLAVAVTGDQSTLQTATETNVASGSSQLAVVSGSGQSSHVGWSFDHPLVVKVTDALGNAIAGQSVTFSLPSSPGAVFAGGAHTVTVVTGATGEAESPALIAGLAPGSFTAIAGAQLGGQTVLVAFALQATDGYWLAGTDGSVQAFGDAPLDGSLAGVHLDKPVVGMAALPDGGGYWLVASDGGVFSFGPDARFHGSTGGVKLVRPIVGMASTPSGDGYWLVASDGGVFAFGDARFYGSTGGVKLNAPIVGMTPTPTGHGYWLVASDGGIFAFGDARFHGSTGNVKLVKPVVGMAAAPAGAGYWLVASDGGVFAFGDARFYGSTGNVKLAEPIVGMAATSSGDGYWFVASDGGVFSFGPDAKFEGSGSEAAQAVVAMAEG